MNLQVAVIAGNLELAEVIKNYKSEEVGESELLIICAWLWLPLHNNIIRKFNNVQYIFFYSALNLFWNHLSFSRQIYVRLIDSGSYLTQIHNYINIVTNTIPYIYNKNTAFI